MHAYCMESLQVSIPNENFQLSLMKISGFNSKRRVALFFPANQLLALLVFSPFLKLTHYITHLYHQQIFYHELSIALTKLINRTCDLDWIAYYLKLIIIIKKKNSWAVGRKYINKIKQKRKIIGVLFSPSVLNYDLFCDFNLVQHPFLRLVVYFTCSPSSNSIDQFFLCFHTDS